MDAGQIAKIIPQKQSYVRLCTLMNALNTKATPQNASASKASRMRIALKPLDPLRDHELGASDSYDAADRIVGFGS